MPLSDVFTNLGNNLRNVSGITNKLSITEMSKVVEGLSSVNLIPNPDENWHHIEKEWNVPIARINTTVGQKYHASVEVKNVSGGLAALMYAMYDENNQPIDIRTGKATNLVNAIALPTGDLGSTESLLHSGTIEVTDAKCKTLELRIGGNAAISVDYRKAMLSNGTAPIPYTSKHIVGGVVKAVLSALHLERRCLA